MVNHDTFSILKIKPSYDKKNDDLKSRNKTLIALIKIPKVNDQDLC
jgi:hypothetical protein